MARPVTLFTGQWADLTLDTVAQKAASFGYDGLELACWGDHFEVDKALESDAYVRGRRDILEKHGLKSLAISNHLVGQCVSDRYIDERHKAILPARLWGDGNPDGVRQRAAEEIKNTARAAKLFGVNVVNGFTGSRPHAIDHLANQLSVGEHALSFSAFVNRGLGRISER